MPSDGKSRPSLLDKWGIYLMSQSGPLTISLADFPKQRNKHSTCRELMKLSRCFKMPLDLRWTPLIDFGSSESVQRYEGVEHTRGKWDGGERR